MQEPLLRMPGVTKAFPGVKALDPVYLTFKKGKVLAFLGYNGGGGSQPAQGSVVL